MVGLINKSSLVDLIGMNQSYRTGGIRMAKKGETRKCGECGVVVMVTEECDCEPCDIICCGVPMKPVKKKK
jgi:hypothetical protein